MKKILLIALMALCSVSFGAENEENVAEISTEKKEPNKLFDDDFRKCVHECVDKKGAQNAAECAQVDCIAEQSDPIHRLN